MKLPDEIYDNWIPLGGSVFRQKRCIQRKPLPALVVSHVHAAQTSIHGSSLSWAGLSWNPTATFGDDIFCCPWGPEGIRAIWAKLSSLVRRESGGWRLPFQPLGALMWGADAWHPPCNQETTETNSWLCRGERWETTSYIFILLLNSLTWNCWPLDFLLDNKCAYCLNSS